MSSTSFLEDAESHLAPRTPPYSRPTTAFSDLGLAAYSPSLNLLDTQRAAASSTSRLQTKHKRSHTEGHEARRSIGKISKLLGTVLGTPFVPLPATGPVDTRMPGSRSASPSPSMDYTLVSAPSLPTTPHRHSAPLAIGSMRTVTPENATCSSRSMFFTSPSKKAIDSMASLAAPPSPTKSGNQRILPRLWTALSSPTKEAGIRFKRKGKGKAVSSEPSEEYPLDGEEGELVDDEACFVNILTTIDIIASLPPEIALYLLLFLDLRTVLVCLGISRNWRRLASDPLVWRTLFHQPGWEINNELAHRRISAASPLHTRNRRSNSMVSVATSFRNEVDLALSRVRRLQSPPTFSHYPSEFPHGPSPTHGTPRRQSFCSTITATEIALLSSSPMKSSIPEGALAPLTLDWQALYKTRYEIEKRVCGIPPQMRSVDDGEPYVGAEPRVMKLAGHMDSVYCLEFDAYKIVTGSRDKTIKVWSLRTGKLKSTLRGHEGSVLCLKFDASGFMVSGSSDRRILVWDLARGEVRKVLTGHQGGVLDLRVDKQWIVSCAKDAVIRVWDRNTLKPHCSLHGHDGPVNAVGLQDGKIVSASGDGRMMLWDIATARRIRTFNGQDPGLACIEYKDDYICSGSTDWNIKVWSASTGQHLTTLTGHTALVRALSFNPRTGRLISGSYDKTVKMWDIRTGSMIREFRNAHESHIFDVKFDASHIVSTSHDQKIVVLDWSYGLDATLFV
ncbi:WD40-repeat-containing domain protein [Gautieria morchelliformis]|nr:WD40-repeat-containing domain protein [Gautieria morchelliformis]